MKCNVYILHMLTLRCKAAFTILLHNLRLEGDCSCITLVNGTAIGQKHVSDHAHASPLYALPMLSAPE